MPDARPPEPVLPVTLMRVRDKLHFLERHRKLIAGCGLICLLTVLANHYRLSMAVGESMLPTLNTGDLLLVDKLVYQNTDPRRGDIVVVRSRKELIVKRVVGLPGEEVEVINGTLSIDGAPQMEDHKIRLGPLTIAKGKLLEGRFAVLGDNRALPLPQIVHAIVSKDQILGKVIFPIRLAWLRRSET